MVLASIKEDAEIAHADGDEDEIEKSLRQFLLSLISEEKKRMEKAWHCLTVMRKTRKSKVDQVSTFVFSKDALTSCI